MPHNDTLWASRQRHRRMTAARNGAFQPPRQAQAVQDPNLVARLRAAERKEPGVLDRLVSHFTRRVPS